VSRWNPAGAYWVPAYEILEQRGFEVILVNARYAKNVPGRKTDVSDAAWLRQLHSYGLLRGSFRPHAEIATLRAYLVSGSGSWNTQPPTSSTCKRP
jgi:transposase